MRVVAHGGAAAFLYRARDWLEQREDEHNLVLGIASTLAESPAPFDGPAAPFFATVEDGDTVVGCAFRTPPHKVGVTRMPIGAAPLLVEALAERYDVVPAVLGPPEVARAVAEAWVARHGGRAETAMSNRIYRVDRVVPPAGVAGRMRTVHADERALVDRWADGFVADTRHDFATTPGARDAWMRSGGLHLWEDVEPVAMALATGATRRGIRIGYVYTPPGRRGHGYASALTAALSRKLIGEGFAFCVLYTDLANPTSNAIYARVGYRPVCDVEDVRIV